MSSTDDRIKPGGIPTTVRKAKKKKQVRPNTSVGTVTPSEAALLNPTAHPTVHPSVAPTVRRKVGGTKCIYFRDSAQLTALEEIQERYPRASASSIVQQLVEGFLKCMDQRDPNEEGHEVPIITTVFL